MGKRKRYSLRALAILLCLCVMTAQLPCLVFADEAGNTESVVTASEPTEDAEAPETPEEPLDPEASETEGDADVSAYADTVAEGVAIDESHFPDAIFRQYVQDNCDTNGDGILDTEEIAAVTSIEVSDEGISDLAGIEYFTALENLDCEDNKLTELDMSQNTALRWLACSDNQLTSLDVSRNTALTCLYCYSNSQTIVLDVNRQLDVAAFTGFDVSKASEWTGGTVKGTVLTVDSGAEEVTYTYDCGNGYTASFKLKVTPPEIPDGLNKLDGTWKYYKNGAVDTSFTGLTEQFDTWFYVQNGVLDFNYTGLVKDFDTWFYVENGTINWNYSGLVKQFGTWFYVDKGILNWQFTGLVKQFGTWFYVENSVLDWGYTGLVKDFGTWFYVDKNILNWQFTGLVKQFGAWFYVEKNVLNWNYTGLVKQFDTWFYVEKGVLKWDYSGFASRDNIPCYVQNGIVVTSDITETEAYSRLTALQEAYPSGKYWNRSSVTASACNHRAGSYYCNSYTSIVSNLFPTLSSRQCFGFAALLSDTVFGKNAPVSIHTDYNKLKVGDNIRLTSYGHSMIVLTKTDTEITVAECNADFRTCVIQWGRKITRTELEKYNRVYMTRYPDAQSDGTAAVGTTTTAVNIRSGPGTDYPILASVPAGTRFSIINKLDDYYLIETLNGKQGYMRSSYINVLFSN